MSENLEGKILKKRYKLSSKIGSGGFGTIYTARDITTALGGEYVIKYFSPNYENEKQLSVALRLFRQEANSLQQLGNHPQIPRIVDFFEEENNFFLVQELIEGKNLRQELSETKHFNQSQVIKLLTDVLEVLKFIHESGYIHRDIKPSNLIRNRFDGRFFVIDFGAVKEKINPKNIGIQGKFTRTVGILSPGYTPEEQYNGIPKFCSDIYALGMVAIEALTKVHPQDLSRNINSELMWRDFLIPYFEYDLNLLNLIDKMVENNSLKRYQSPVEVLKDLTQVNIDQLTNLYKPRPSPEQTTYPQKEAQTLLTESPRKIYPWQVLTGLGMFGAIAILTGFFLKNFQRSDFVTYENENIRVDYPKDWQRENNSNFLNNSVSFISPQESDLDKFQERVTLTVEESSKPLSLTEYTNQAVAQIESLSNFILSPPRATKLDQSIGKYVIYQGNEQNIKVKRHELWTVNYKKIYTVIYTSEPDKYNKFLPTVEKMIQSVEILE